MTEHMAMALRQQLSRATEDAAADAGSLTPAEFSISQEATAINIPLCPARAPAVAVTVRESSTQQKKCGIRIFCSGYQYRLHRELLPAPAKARLISVV